MGSLRKSEEWGEQSAATGRSADCDKWNCNLRSFTKQSNCESVVLAECDYFAKRFGLATWVALP